MSELISHAEQEEQLETRLEKIANRIHEQGDLPHANVELQLTLLSQLAEFYFGRFLIQNQGINGYWTDYMLTHPWQRRAAGLNNKHQPMTEMERFVLDKSPTMKATQQRFQIFLQENQAVVKEQASLACIPCGMMGELLYLDFTAISQIELHGIDLDKTALSDATKLAEKKQLEKFTHFEITDAFELNKDNQFDLISSNGLNIYQPDQDKVAQLYQQFHGALKPSGKLVTSFLTFPPGFSDVCEWQMEHIDMNDLLMQKLLFVDILQGKFQSYSSTEQTRQQLIEAGFKQIEFIYDDARIFPTVVAYA